MAVRISNWSITANSQHWICILDPSLALSPYGLPLINQLGKVMEIWLVRELWHIIDNIQFYLQEPESLLLPVDVSAKTDVCYHYDGQRSDRCTHEFQDMIQSLHAWETARIEIDPSRLNCYWIGDRPGESFLPERLDASVIPQWEALAQSLDLFLQHTPDVQDTLATAYRDAIALSAILKSAFILTYQSPDQLINNLPPYICTTLEDWGVPCQQLDPLEPTVAIERENIRHLIVQAGLSKFLWAGLHLDVLHLFVPAATRISYTVEQALASSVFPETENYAKSVAPSHNLWRQTQGFWYQI